MACFQDKKNNKKWCNLHPFLRQRSCGVWGLECGSACLARVSTEGFCCSQRCWQASPEKRTFISWLQPRQAQESPRHRGEHPPGWQKTFCPQHRVLLELLCSRLPFTKAVFFFCRGSGWISYQHIPIGSTRSRKPARPPKIPLWSWGLSRLVIRWKVGYGCSSHRYWGAPSLGLCSPQPSVPVPPHREHVLERSDSREGEVVAGAKLGFCSSLPSSLCALFMPELPNHRVLCGETCLGGCPVPVGPPESSRSTVLSLPVAGTPVGICPSVSWTWALPRLVLTPSIAVCSRV